MPSGLHVHLQLCHTVASDGPGRKLSLMFTQATNCAFKGGTRRDAVGLARAVSHVRCTCTAGSNLAQLEERCTEAASCPQKRDTVRRQGTLHRRLVGLSLNQRHLTPPLRKNRSTVPHAGEMRAQVAVQPQSPCLALDAGGGEGGPLLPARDVSSDLSRFRLLFRVPCAHIQHPFRERVFMRFS